MGACCVLSCCFAEDVPCCPIQLVSCFTLGSWLKRILRRMFNFTFAVHFTQKHDSRHMPNQIYAFTLSEHNAANICYSHNPLTTDTFVQTMLICWHLCAVQDFQNVIKAPGRVMLGALLQYTIMPMMGFAVSRLAGLPTPFAIG